MGVCGKRMCWLGLGKDPATGVWSWTDGSSSKYRNWQLGEPSNTEGEDRVVMHLNMHWSSRKSRITDIPAGFNSKLRWWADGKWYDSPSRVTFPITICKSRPVAEEPCPHNPQNPWIAGPTGDCYFVDRRRSSYWDAVTRCGSAHSGATLVSISSARENRFVQELCGLNICWLGGHEHRGRYHLRTDFAADRSDGSERWHWLDGTPFDYRNWAEGQPDNFGQDENAIFMNFDWGEFKKIEMAQIQEQRSASPAHSSWLGSVPAVLITLLGIAAAAAAYKCRRRLRSTHVSMNNRFAWQEHSLREVAEVAE